MSSTNLIALYVLIIQSHNNSKDGTTFINIFTVNETVKMGLLYLPKIT